MGKDKRRRRQIEEQLLALLRKSQEKDPHMEFLKNLNRRVIDWHTGSGKDIYKHPLLGGKLAGANYLTASADRNNSMIGQGALGSKGLREAKGGYGRDLALQRKYNRDLAIGKFLNDTLSNEVGGASSSLTNLVGNDYDRMFQGGNMMGMGLNHFNSKIHPSFLSSLFGGLSGGIGAGIGKLIKMI